MDTILLQVSDLTKHFRGLTAVDNLSFNVNKGQILGLIGPNGAGKTTVFNLITGFYNPSGGRIIFGGRDITGRQPCTIAALGLVRTFQSNFLFDELTCCENVMVAHHLHRKANFIDMLFNTRSCISDEVKTRKHVQDLLERAGLGQLSNQLAGSLPQGLKRILGVAVALAAEPKLLLLDEPAAGMSHNETRVMRELIQQLSSQGLTIILVEHNMKLVMGMCSNIIVLNFGSKLAEGTSEYIVNNRDVIQAYTGGEGSKEYAS